MLLQMIPTCIKLRAMSYNKSLAVNTKHKQILAGGLSVAMHLLVIVTLLAQAEPEVEGPRQIMMVSMVEIPKPAPALLAGYKPEPKPSLEPEHQAEPAPENEPLKNTDTFASQETQQEAQDEIKLPQFQADYLQNSPPVYPRVSQRLKEQGEVLLRVHVGVDGEPLEISLQQSSSYSRLDQAAQKAVIQWRFEPAESNGKPVTAWVVVPFKFTLGG